MVQVKNKVCLIVHDGWGIAPEGEGNAISKANSPNMTRLSEEFPYRTLAAHGNAVGLPDGLMGNSEVGHLNIGAGRIVWQSIVRIDLSIKNDKLGKKPAKDVESFKKNEGIQAAVQRAAKGNGRLHLLGLISDGGVHSNIEHVYALLDVAREAGVKDTYVHFFGDGRDTGEKTGLGFLKSLQKHFADNKYGSLATVSGRYYAMDRDKRWERITLAMKALINGEGEQSDDIVKSFETRYANSEKEGAKGEDYSDEFIKPTVLNKEGTIKDDDTLFFFNFRADRMRQITTIFGQVEDHIPEVKIPKNLDITTMTPYKAEFPFHVAFRPHSMANVLADWLSQQGVKQSHIAETEKYAHVTFFFNGGVEKQFAEEERHMIPSPKVPTYRDQPPMSAVEVAQKVATVVQADTHEFVMCNFAPPDMVGHTGDLAAAKVAIDATDKAVQIVWEACEKAGYVLLITADHGNAEQMKNPETGEPHTAHTTNPVPFIMAGADKKYSFAKDGEGEEEKEGALADVAPTVLALMGISQPDEMNGHSLLKTMA